VSCVAGILLQQPQTPKLPEDWEYQIRGSWCSDAPGAPGVPVVRIRTMLGYPQEM